MTSRMRKALSAVISVSVAIFIAAPAFASKSKKKKVSPSATYAAQTQRAVEPHAIYGWDGGYRGWDPDPNIRFQLMRDQNMPND